LQKLQADLQQRQTELATRLEMSQMNHQRSMEQAELSAATKMAQEALKSQSNIGIGNGGNS
jgi:DNA-binding Xre family transcriptional regulator